jgi:hypothetical protein
MSGFIEKQAPAGIDWFQAVSEGLIDGYSILEKFGVNPEIAENSDPEDVWDGGGVYTFSTSADIAEIASSNDNDTQDILITGLNVNWIEITQTVTLSGQTPIALSIPLIRVYRMINIGTADILGSVRLATTAAIWNNGVPTVETTVRAQITDGNNQTLMCVYSVPAGKTAYFYGGYVSATNTSFFSSGAAICSWRARPFGGVFAVQSKIGLMGAGNSTWSYAYKVPIAVNEKADILIRCEEVSETTGLSGGFTIVLKEN